jgi:hypothetical protein
LHRVTRYNPTLTLAKIVGDGLGKAGEIEGRYFFDGRDEKVPQASS